MADPEIGQIDSDYSATSVVADKPRTRDSCRNCGCKRGEGGEWYDDEYCSGKCKKLDGGDVAPVEERAKVSGPKASLDDYILDYPKNLGEKVHGQRIKGRIPKRYRRRHDPEKLNWGEPLTREQLKQAGLRANREPIPGDWDYVEQEVENV